jgi:hypothetical protein
MRLWSLHPQYLDAKGLVALWREGLLAQKILLGHTKGYNHHPQLFRFRHSGNPLACIAYYLHQVQLEASNRKYNFAFDKIITPNISINAGYINLTQGQLEFEWQHLMLKLQQRAPQHYILVQNLVADQPPMAHPLFNLIVGEVENWEKSTSRRG